MKGIRGIIRLMIVVLAAAEAACWIFVAYFGFSLARFAKSHCAWKAWSQSAISAALGVFFCLTAVGLWRTTSWSRALAAGGSLVLVAYDAIEYSYYWSHLVLGAVAMLSLLFAVSRGPVTALGKA